MAPDGPATGGTLLTEPVLVVQREADPAATAPGYRIHDQLGRRLAAVHRVGPHELRAVGADDRVLLRVTRLREPPMSVTDAAGDEIGRIVRDDVFGRVRFALRSGDRHCGSVHADDLRGWNFAVLDHTGAEVARITRTWEGLADALVMTADDHVLQLRRPLPEPLRTLVVAAALAVDPALRWG